MKIIKSLVGHENCTIDKKKKRVLMVLGAISVICYVVFEILLLHSLYTQSGLVGTTSEEVAEQISNRGSMRNLFELGIYIFFMIYSWYAWSNSTVKKYKIYIIYMLYVIISVFGLGLVFFGIQYLLMGIASNNHFMPGIILIWFAVLNLLLTSGMQAKKDKIKK